ncbi:unnamed protein product [Leuciscus chuanchicus]
MSKSQQLKVAGTCVSHLTVVCISYVSAAFVYISYRVAKFDPDVRIVIAVLYSVLTPLLNPIIYSLRNKELQNAMKRAFSKASVDLSGLFGLAVVAMRQRCDLQKKRMEDFECVQDCKTPEHRVVS